MNTLAESIPSAPTAKHADGPMIMRLRQLVNENTRRWRLVIVLESLGFALAAPLAYLWLVFLVDNLVHLPLFGRVLANLGLLGGIGWAGYHLVRRWRSIRLTEDEVALAIERSTPGGVQNRVINALQLSRETHALSDAVVEENCERLEQIRLEQAAQMRPAAVRMGVAGLLVLVGIGFWIVSPEQFTNAASRIFLPLAKIDPLYRTVLTIEPGDIEASGEATIAIHIEGERPKTLVVFKTVDGKRSSETISVPADDGDVMHTFRDVHQSFDYSVRGNDFTSPTYRVTTPTNASLVRIRVTYEYPAYTGQPAKDVEARSGDLEAIEGTTAKLAFTFDQPVDSASVVIERTERTMIIPPTMAQSAKEFVAEITLRDVLGYRVEFSQGDHGKRKSPAYAIRIIKDQEPKLELAGLERRGELQIESAPVLQIDASDDFGLEQVGLFYRRALTASAKTPPPNDGWLPIEVWQTDKKTSFQKKIYALTVSGMQVAEGERIEIALRGRDTAPHRTGVWTTGAIHELSIGGDSARLQIEYEQIVQSEKDLKNVLRVEQESLNQTIVWLRKLDGGSDIRWDDPKNVDALHAAARQLAKDHEKLQASIGEIARAMLAQTGNVRIALGLLADTEIVRLQRMFDAVASREKVQDKRGALADARATQERIIRSMEELFEQHVAFRGDWELANMIPFAKMLAERQIKLRDESQKHAKAMANVGLAAQRRQAKVADLCSLIQPAFVGISQRLGESEPGIAKAFFDGSRVLAGDNLRGAFAKADEAIKANRWSDVVMQQTIAGDQLHGLHDQLRKAQLEAAMKALAALREKLKSDLEAQKELEKLAPGTTEAFLKDYPDKLKLEDLMRIQDVVGAKKKKGQDGKDEGEPDYKNAPLVDVDRNAIELKKDSGVRQDPYSLRLGTTSEKTPILNLPKDKEPNAVKPFVQEKFDDLVGKLLDEADELHKTFQSLKLSTNQNNNDPGEISKVGGTLNSTGAVTATGNKKPPTTESGGLSRTGRQGARATGMVADDDGVNRRGRDKALEGTQEVADQKGLIKMKKSDDMQKDTSTGVGGKKVESDDTHFSLSDTGKWKDEYTKRMDKPQKKQYIVERQGDKIDAKTAALLRDLTSQQEQVIERLKAIKKELRNLYLPTEHLDELAASLQSNLASLQEQPDPELFRQQLQTLDRLRGALRVFRGANASFQPSLPRDRAVRGRVLDEPGAPGLSGYEDAVRHYYLRLAGQ